MPFDPKQFTTPVPKPLPVILLLDTSGSMDGAKIQDLNRAVNDMLTSFTSLVNIESDILVSIITFGYDVSLHLPYTKAPLVQWKDMVASGSTPLGVALTMAKAMIEDKETTPSRSYRPTVVLVSDGQPTDRWEEPLRAFISEGRSSKCDRMAMAIGSDANEDILKKFLDGTQNSLFFAEDSKQIHQFFQKVTMSVTTRSKSKNPNIIPEQSNNSISTGVDANSSTPTIESFDDDVFMF